MADQPAAVDLYGKQYGNFATQLYEKIRSATYGEQIGQNGWLTVPEHDRFIEWLGVDGRGGPFRVLDVACGSGGPTLRIAEKTGCSVDGVDIHDQAIERAREAAAGRGLANRARFQRVDASGGLPFNDETFDAVICIDAINHLPDRVAVLREWYRVLKPGARYACSEYLLSPYFDWNNEEHVALHKTYLPTLAATQSMYPADVCSALERAGFEILVSAPSKSEAWPLCEQKRDLILMGRRVVRVLEAIRVLPPWVEESLDLLQTGGQAWTDAEKAKIADLNWRIVAEKR
jgi:sterol 24-C-methyltransferase